MVRRRPEARGGARVLFFFFWFLVILVFWVLKPLKTGLFIDPLGDRGAEIELYAKLAPMS